MSAKHTPGPWKARPDGQHDWKVWSEDFGTIVNRSCYPNPKVDSCVEADARLIAAAPELLEALEDVVYQLEIQAENVGIPETSGYYKHLEAARAAIAKARGE